MQITLTSLMVEDQDRALAFCTIVLEPLAFPPARTFQKALFDAGVPATAFIAKNLGPITAVIFEDACGKLINLVHRPPPASSTSASATSAAGAARRRSACAP